MTGLPSSRPRPVGGEPGGGMVVAGRQAQLMQLPSHGRSTVGTQCHGTVGCGQRMDEAAGQGGHETPGLARGQPSAGQSPARVSKGLLLQNHSLEKGAQPAGLRAQGPRARPLQPSCEWGKPQVH